MSRKIAKKLDSKDAKRSNRKRGRPRKDAHLDDYDSLGEPPSDVLAIGRWLQDVVATTGYQAKCGQGSRELRDGIRKTCKAAARLLPSAMTARALGLIEPNDDDEDIDPDDAPPTDPLRVNEWFLLNLVNDVYAQITGTADAQLSTELRESSLAAAKVYPPDVMVEAHRALREDMARSEHATGPEPIRFADIDVEPVGGEDDTRPLSLNQHDWRDAGRDDADQ